MPRPYRRRKINPQEVPPVATEIPAGPSQSDLETLAAARRANPDAVQQSINKWADAGESGSGVQVDSQTVTAKSEAALDNDELFQKQYESGVARAIGQLDRRRLTSGKTMLVPPECVIHPELGEWGLRYGGKWMMIRWIGMTQRYRQRRFQEGYQYFEGRSWCIRLGLDPESYLNEKGRIQANDTELGWCPEERRFSMLSRVKQAQKDMQSTTVDKLMNSQDGKYVKRLEVLEGDEEGVMGELRARRDFAQSRS